MNENKLQKPIASPYGHFTKANEIVNGMNLSGKLAVVTGGYTGIGLYTTKALTSAGARVIVLARDLARARRNLRGINNIEIEYFDLLKPDTIDAVADKVLKTGRPVHYLINSAGIINTPLTRDKRGYEYQFATNHLGHFQLTARLYPALKMANGARVIEVASRGHRFGSVLFDDVHFNRTEYNGMRAYAQSKSATALFAVKLDELAKKDKVRAFAVHPGPIPTSDLFAESLVGIKPPWVVSLIRLSAQVMRGLHVTELLNILRHPRIEDAFKTIEQGASTLVWCAVSSDLNDLGGVYCEDCNIAQAVSADSDEPYGVRPWAINPELATRLWKLSEELTGVTFRF
ncbi:short-chain dehydrogenase/reductase sdr [Lucifera butyrica]|uniref:Short-chain dehydrogenase/reductase sdr n=1 Tax=Lucifera butyrica TaxID=1351585 RepID=A0A498R7P7_9FIRM|nr:SDR family NAD(P)-dependent oxidoreductase [Lucifera butyrica]VBB06927.1 short-chain dehydrogenase/reductase sdr [Lucifera butyrica]